MHDEHGRCRYWRAPRPRPRPHRRQNRRRRQQIIKAALSNENTPSTTPAQDVIQVLQTSLQNLLRRTESAEKELQMARERITGGDQLRQLRVTYSICRIDYFQDPTVVMVSSGRSVVHNRLTGHDPSIPCLIKERDTFKQACAWFRWATIALPYLQSSFVWSSLSGDANDDTEERNMHDDKDSQEAVHDLRLHPVADVSFKTDAGGPIPTAARIRKNGRERKT